MNVNARPTALLGDLVEIFSGFAFKSERFGSAGELPLVRIRDVKRGYSDTYYTGEFDDRYIVEDGNILIGMDGEFNRERWQGGRALLNQRVCKISADASGLDEGYLYHFLPKALKEIEDQTPFATVKHLSSKDIKAIQIPLPPLDEQRRIAVILDGAAALCRKRKHALKLLDELTQSVFVELFGDPIENPRNYPTKRLVNLVDEARGISYGIVQRGDDLSDGVGVIRISDFHSGKLDTSSLKKTSPDISNKYKRTILRGGEIVISIRGTVGRCAEMPDSVSGANVSREVAVIPTLSREKNRFYLALIRSPSTQRRIAGDIKGVAQSGINLEDLRDLAIIQPDEEDMWRFRAATDLLAKLEAIQAAASWLAEGQFESLQHRAFSGQL